MCRVRWNFEFLVNKRRSRMTFSFGLKVMPLELGRSFAVGREGLGNVKKMGFQPWKTLFQIYEKAAKSVCFLWRIRKFFPALSSKMKADFNRIIVHVCENSRERSEEVLIPNLFAWFRVLAKIILKFSCLRVTFTFIAWLIIALVSLILKPLRAVKWKFSIYASFRCGLRQERKWVQMSWRTRILFDNFQKVLFRNSVSSLGFSGNCKFYRFVWCQPFKSFCTIDHHCWWCEKYTDYDMTQI